MRSSEQQRSERELLETLRAGDPRPLLIVRTPAAADAKVKKKLDRVLANERVILATHWFRCVRLETRAAEAGSPHHALFRGRRAPHLILASADGRKVVRMLATASEQVPWSKIVGLLKFDYRGNADRAVKELQKLLSRYDHLDARATELRAQLGKAKASGRSAQVAKLEAELEDVAKERDAALAEEKKLRELERRSAAPAQPARRAG